MMNYNATERNTSVTCNDIILYSPYFTVMFLTQIDNSNNIM